MRRTPVRVIDYVPPAVPRAHRGMHPTDRIVVAGCIGAVVLCIALRALGWI